MLENNKKFRVIEEGLMTREEMVKVEGGCHPCDFYGCDSSIPNSLTITECVNMLYTCAHYHVCSQGFPSNECCEQFQMCTEKLDLSTDLVRR